MWLGNWGAGPVWTCEEDEGRGRKPRKRYQCLCPIPEASSRPSGRIRHDYCRSCHGQWNMRTAIDKGWIIFGWRGKHKGKMLWAFPWKRVSDVPDARFSKTDGGTLTNATQ